MIEVVTGLLLLGGGAFCLISAIGIIRLPDALMRMHASTKAGTLGSTLVLVAAMLAFWEGIVTTKGIAAVLFLLLTAPIAAHMIGRAYVREHTPQKVRYERESEVSKQSAD
jgi:multicomponent Na+:H+ antiporter subunit G